MAINLRDQADLSWYHGPGRAAFERSTFGAVLDRVSMMAVPAYVSPELAEERRRYYSEERWDEAPPGQVTANITSEVFERFAEEPSNNNLIRYGGVSRRLSAMDHRHQVCLAAYFGDSAARWARSPGPVGRVGSLGPVLPLTKAGASLVRSEGDKRLTVTPEQVMENVIARHGLGDSRLQGKITSAIAQANAMFAEAAEAWDQSE